MFKLRTNQGETALKAGVAEKGMLLYFKAGEIGFFSGIEEFGLINNQHAPKGRLSKIYRPLKNSAFERGGRCITRKLLKLATSSGLLNWAPSA